MPGLGGTVADTFLLFLCARLLCSIGLSSRLQDKK